MSVETISHIVEVFYDRFFYYIHLLPTFRFRALQGVTEAQPVVILYIS